MTMLLRRKMLIPQSRDWRDLYQQVAYLESSGTQYIETGITPKITSNADSLYVDFSILTSNTVLVFGVGGTGFQLPSVSGYHIRADMVTGGTSKYFGYASNGEKCSFKIENQTATCLGTSYEGAYFNYSNPLILFGKGSYELSTLLIGRIYYFSYTYNSVKQMELIPCYRKSDSKPGMYDTVSGTFYTNDGTGEFTVGPDVTPEGYIKSGLVLWLDGLNIGGASGEWVDLIGGKAFAADTSAHTPTRATNGYTFNGSQWLYGPQYQSGEFSTSTSTVEISISNRSGTAGIIFDGCSGVGAGFYGNKFYGCINADSTLDLKTSGTISATTLTASAQNGKIIINGAEETLAKSEAWSLGNFYMIGRQSAKSAYPFTGTIHSIRIYSRLLTADEMLHNQRIDNARFNLGLTI